MVPPLLHEKVIVPPPAAAVKVIPEPAQTAEAPRGLINTFGAGLIVIVLLAVAEHPAAFETVTVYVVVATGATVMEAESRPVLHAKLGPPEAVSVELVPAQVLTVAGVMVAVTAGTTVTLTDAVPLQPTPLVTVTVYMVEAVGATVIVCVAAPVFQ